MTHDQLTGKYARLRHELAEAYAEPDWSACRSGHIDRIAKELVETERALASSRVPRFGGERARAPFEGAARHH